MRLLMLAPAMGSLLKDGGGAARVVITAPRNRFVALGKEMRGERGERTGRRGSLLYLLDRKRKAKEAKRKETRKKAKD